MCMYRMYISACLHVNRHICTCVYEYIVYVGRNSNIDIRITKDTECNAVCCMVDSGERWFEKP